jgi:hypothetical protein
MGKWVNGKLSNKIWMIITTILFIKNIHNNLFVLINLWFMSIEFNL